LNIHSLRSFFTEFKAMISLNSWFVRHVFAAISDDINKGANETSFVYVTQHGHRSILLLNLYGLVTKQSHFRFHSKGEGKGFYGEHVSEKNLTLPLGYDLRPREFSLTTVLYMPLKLIATSTT